MEKMNTKQKRYTVQKIRKSEELLVQEQRKIQLNSLFLVAVVAVSGWFFVAKGYDQTPIPAVLYDILGVAGIAASMATLKDLITAIAKKAGLESKIDQLMHLLEIDTLATKEESGPKL